MSSQAAATEMSAEVVFKDSGTATVPSALPWDGDDDGDAGIQSCSPPIAPIDSSIAVITLSSLEAEVPSTEELLPPAQNDLPIHRMQTASDLLESARSFSVHSNPRYIRQECLKFVPGWLELAPPDIIVDQILSGLSNQLFKVSLQQSLRERARYTFRDVLFRVYGKDVNQLYDSATEVMVFKKLGRRAVAPRLVAEFDGGRIEEWIEGSALLVDDMAKPNVMMGVAAILAGIHKIDLAKYLPQESCIEMFLKRWRSRALEIHARVTPDDPAYLPIQRLCLPKLEGESYKLLQYLFPSSCARSVVSTLCFCHNDIQENNILVTDSCLRIIDFEYSGYNYPAYDIASYFWEMTCNYLVTSYPFFHIDPTKYPRLEKRRIFMAMYLSKLTKTQVKATDTAVVDLALADVERFLLACHMLWGFWAVIRAPQAATATEFDMLHYAQKRIDAYWALKARLLAEGAIEEEVTV